MGVLTELTDAEVQAIADQVLGKRWADWGYDHTEVVSQDDVYGEPALSVTAWLRVDSPDLPAELYIESALAIRDAIKAEGEQRYSYLYVGRPDDPVLDDEDSDSL